MITKGTRVQVAAHDELPNDIRGKVGTVTDSETWLETIIAANPAISVDDRLLLVGAIFQGLDMGADTFVNYDEPINSTGFSVTGSQLKSEQVIVIE